MRAEVVRTTKLMSRRISMASESRVPCLGVVGEADGVLGLLEREAEALDVLGGVVFGLLHGRRQDELGGLDAVEDGDEELVRLDDGGELVEAEFGVEVAP